MCPNTIPPWLRLCFFMKITNLETVWQYLVSKNFWNRLIWSHRTLGTCYLKVDYFSTNGSTCVRYLEGPSTSGLSHASIPMAMRYIDKRTICNFLGGGWLTSSLRGHRETGTLFQIFICNQLMFRNFVFDKFCVKLCSRGWESFRNFVFSQKYLVFLKWFTSSVVFESNFFWK